MSLSRLNAYEFNATIYRSSQGNYDQRVIDGGLWRWPTIYGYPAWESALGAAIATADCVDSGSHKTDFRIRLTLDGHEFPDVFMSEIDDLVEAYLNEKDKS